MRLAEGTELKRICQPGWTCALESVPNNPFNIKSMTIAYLNSDAYVKVVYEDGVEYIKFDSLDIVMFWKNIE